jgi:hypothetical protein
MLLDLILTLEMKKPSGRPENGPKNHRRKLYKMLKKKGKYATPT